MVYEDWCQYKVDLIQRLHIRCILPELLHKKKILKQKSRGKNTSKEEKIVYLNVFSYIIYVLLSLFFGKLLHNFQLILFNNFIKKYCL